MANAIVGALMLHGFDLVDSSHGANRLVLLGRAPRGTVVKMGPIIKQLYGAAKDQSWSVDVSLLLTVKNGQVVQGLRFIFQDKEDLGKKLNVIAGVIRGTPPVPTVVEVGRTPLLGASSTRNAPALPGGKGAVPAGKFIPRAAMAKMGG